MQDRNQPSVFAHLYFAPWANDSRAFRAGALARERGLADRIEYVGHQTHDHPDREERASGEDFVRLPPRLPAKGGDKARRAAGAIGWIGSVRKHYSSAGAPRLIHCHSLASLPAAVALKHATGAPLLFDAHELESQRVGWPAGVRWGARVTESLLLAHVDHTIVVGDCIRDWYVAREPHREFTTVRNVPSVEWEKGRRSPRLRSALGLNDNAFLFLYLGLLNHRRGVPELLRIFASAPRDRHIAFVGFGEAQGEIQAAAQAHTNIHFHPAVAPHEICEMASGADVGLAIIEMSALSYRFAAPNKLFEYIAAGLCVICTDGPEMRAVVEESGLGWLVANGDEAGLQHLILSLDRQEVRARAATTSYRAPTWASEGQKLAEIYGRLLQGRRERARAALIG